MTRRRNTTDLFSDLAQPHRVSPPPPPAAAISAVATPGGAVPPAPPAPAKKHAARGAGRAVGSREQEIQRAILKALALQPGVFAERQNTGAIGATYKGKDRFIRFSRPGAPDIRAVVNGRALAIEVKRPGGKQSDSQREYEAAFTKAGGLYRVVHSVAEALAAVAEAREGSNE